MMSRVWPYIVVPLNLPAPRTSPLSAISQLAPWQSSCFSQPVPISQGKLYGVALEESVSVGKDHARTLSAEGLTCEQLLSFI